MWIEIFKSGSHTDSNGNKKAYSINDLNKIIDVYNNKVAESDSFEAPLVKGHPGSDEPAFGWVEQLQRKGDKLLAKLKDVTPELMKEIRDGRFKKVSVALYNDFMLRHVGLLGAMPPAIKGLKNVAFSENNYSEINQEINSDLLNDELNNLILFNEELKNNLEVIISEKNNLKKELDEINNREFIEEIKTKLNFNELISNDLINLFSEINNYDKGEEINNKIKNILLNIENRNLTENYFDKIKFEQNNYSEFENVNKDRLKLHEKINDILNLNPTLTYEEALLQVK